MTDQTQDEVMTRMWWLEAERRLWKRLAVGTLAAVGACILLGGILLDWHARSLMERAEKTGEELKRDKERSEQLQAQAEKALAEWAKQQPEVAPEGPKLAPKAPDLPPLFRKLGLSDEQVATVAKVRAKYDAKVKELEEKIKAARAEEAAEVEKVLTEDQRARLRELRKDTPAKGP